MKAQNLKLGGKAFAENADQGLLVAYQSQQDALRFLSSAISGQNGVALLQGPTGSGKTMTVREQLAWSARDAETAYIDGIHLAPRRLLTEMMTQFDVPTGALQDDQLLQSLGNFLAQQTRRGPAPLLVIDDANRASSSALRLLNWLAAQDVRGKYTLRIILTGKEPLSALLRDKSMSSLARRNPAIYSLNPLTARETMIYLRTKLLAAGGERSEKVFPIDVCEKLRDESKGWPGMLNQLALQTIEEFAATHAAPPVPRIVVTRDGKVVARHELTGRQYVIGRSDLADIIVEDNYVSKVHAMLQVYSNAIVLADLNSTNGTTVNSREVQKAILKSDDVISMGHYRLKVENAPVLSSEMSEKIKATDTLTMQNLGDLRRARARRMVKLISH